MKAGNNISGVDRARTISFILNDRWNIYEVKVHRYNHITTEQKYNKQISKCQKHLQTTTHE